MEEERSNSFDSNIDYNKLFNMNERKIVQINSAYKELMKNVGTDYSEDIKTIKEVIEIEQTLFTTCHQIFEPLQHMIKNYKEIFSDVTSEINEVMALAKDYEHLNEGLRSTLITERSSWQSKNDELVEQIKKQKIEYESQINEFKAKIQDYEADLNDAEREIELTKAKSESKELSARQLVQHVRFQILNLTRELNSTKNKRDCLRVRVDQLEKGELIPKYKIQIAHLEQENHKLIMEKKHITIEKDRLTHDIKMLNLHVTALNRRFASQQVKQNENGQAMESSISNITSSSVSGPSTEPEPSFTVCTSEPSCSSIDMTTHSNTQRKQKFNQIMPSYMKKSAYFMFRESIRQKMENETSTSFQQNAEINNSYTGPESNPQDNKLKKLF